MGSIHDRHHSCLRLRVPNNLSCDAHSWRPAPLFTKELGHDYHGWAIYTDGGTRVVDGETVAGWGVISRSPRGRIYVMFGPVITTEAHLAFFLVPEHTPTTPLK